MISRQRTVQGATFICLQTLKGATFICLQTLKGSSGKCHIKTVQVATFGEGYSKFLGENEGK